MDIIFDKIDVNGDGSLDEEEFHRALGLMGDEAVGVFEAYLEQQKEHINNDFESRYLARPPGLQMCFGRLFHMSGSVLLRR